MIADTTNSAEKNIELSNEYLLGGQNWLFMQNSIEIDCCFFRRIVSTKVREKMRPISNGYRGFGSCRFVREQGENSIVLD